MRTRWATALTLLTLTIAPAGATLMAQSEGTLKQAFEGKSVTLRLAMPGTEDGVDIHPSADKPLDYARYADRLKDNGTALKKGQEAMVTKVKVKGKLIEFQLDGGGYGTMGDETSSNVSTSSAPKTRREKNLETELKRTSEPNRRRAIKEELDGLKADRAREDERNRAEVAAAEEQKAANIRQRRLEGGSRFNLRYKEGVPREAMTPEGVMRALAAYVNFGDLAKGVDPAAASAEGPGVPDDVPAAGAPAEPVALVATPGQSEPDRRALPRRGMMLDEVDALLGKPTSEARRKEGTLTVVKRVYRHEEGKVTAEFVEGVLFRYSMTSE